MIAGESQPPAVHALAHAINEALGAVGTTVDLHRARRGRAGRRDGGPRGARRRDAARARSRCSSILGSNPVYAAPADLDFAAALDKVPLRIHHGLYLDETAERCHWHLPASHPLESWGDLRAADGTVSIVQPLIAPLYNTLSEHRGPGRLPARASRRATTSSARHWEAQLGAADFEKRWNRALHDGVVAGTAFAAEAR